MIQFRFTLVFLLCLSVQLLQAELSVDTRFSQPRVKVGSTTQYIVEVTVSSDSSQPKVDPISALPIRPPQGLRLHNGRSSQQSTQTRIMNGRAEYSVTQSAVLDVTANEIGEFTIPAFTMQINGEATRAPAATLTVVASHEDAQPTMGELLFLDNTTT